MTAALAILAKQRGDVTFVHQSLYYPVTDAAQDTDSYGEFADGPLPDRQGHGVVLGLLRPGPRAARGDHRIPAARLADELSGLPPAFLIVDENDVLRDEGEAYARRLLQAGVPTTSVRYNGTLHDFMMLNPRAAVPRRNRCRRTGDPRPAHGAGHPLIGKGDRHAHSTTSER